jgi:glycosyltransferase involved in cell wall biosynthesis
VLRSPVKRSPRRGKRPPRSLGIYNDGPVALIRAADGPRVAPDPADFPFLTFACEVGAKFDSAVLFGRKAARFSSDADLLLPPGLGLVELPHYESLLRLDQVARAVPGTAIAFWRGLSRVDAVWIFGPHPFAVLFAVLALSRGKEVVLGVRQDTAAYFRARLPSARWKAALLAVRAWDGAFRGLARSVRTTVVGAELARVYGGERSSLLTMTVSLVRDGDVVDDPPARDWAGPIELFTAGRIEQEKNPLLLVEALARLEQADPGRYRLGWAGTGPLEDAVRQRAKELGLSQRVELLGFVPFGPALLERYRRAHAFVHVSFTEGVPAVLIEAFASGTPVVATAVGGVPAALDHGRAGLLVPPGDVDALVGGVIRVVNDHEARERRLRRALELAREGTLDAQAARIARFIKGPVEADPPSNGVS